MVIGARTYLVTKVDEGAPAALASERIAGEVSSYQVPTHTASCCHAR